MYQMSDRNIYNLLEWKTICGFFSAFFKICFYHKSGIANNRHKSIDYNVLLYGKVYLRWKKSLVQTLNQSCKIMDFGVFHLSIL